MRNLFLSIVSVLTLLSCSSDDSTVDTNQNLLQKTPPGTDVPTIPIDMGGGSACTGGSRVVGNCDAGQFNGSFNVDCAGRLNISGSYARNSNGGMDISNFQASYVAIINNPTISILSTNKIYIASNNWIIITVNYKKTTLVYPLPNQTGSPTSVVTNHNAAFYLKPCDLMFG